MHFFNQYGMTEISKEDFNFILNLGVLNGEVQYNQDFNAVEKEVVAEELESIIVDKEGKRKLVYSYKYERSPKLRKEALRIHGYKCKACGFDFEERYGELGKGFIEVHHIRPLYTIESESSINPEVDLVPLCANCHRMIHRSRKDVLTVQELKEILRNK